MNDKEISFIIPIYNTDINMLKNCIESIVAQKINDYELILINDGSDSVELNNICINYSYNPNVKYIFQSNFGSAVARNKGLEQATGKFIMFIDADDALEPDFYEKFTSFKNHNFDVMIFNYCFWDSYNEEWIIFNENRCIDLSNRKDELYQNVMFGSSFNCFFMGSIWSKCFSRKFIIDNKIFFSNRLRKAQDRTFMLEVHLKAKCVLFKPIYCYKYRINENSITHVYDKNMYKYYNYLYEEMNKFCIVNNIPYYSKKYLELGIVYELSEITVFNKQNHNKYKIRKNEFYNIYNNFNLKISCSKLKLNDFLGIKSKIKFLLYKYKLFFLLDFFIYARPSDSLVKNIKAQFAF